MISVGTVSYDASGNLLNDTFNIYTWGDYNELASVNGNAVIEDAFGRMVQNGGQNGGGATQFAYSPAGGPILASMNGPSLNVAIVPLTGNGEFAVYGGSGLIQYNHGDWLGSGRLYSTPAQSTSGIAYAPFGEGYAATSSNTYVQFTATGNVWTQNDDNNDGGTLDDFMYRRYNPTQGRWISPDPAGLAAANPTNPQSWNRYGYVMNNPLNMVDPLGLGCPPTCPKGSWDKSGDFIGGLLTDAFGNSLQCMEDGGFVSCGALALMIELNQFGPLLQMNCENGDCENEFVGLLDAHVTGYISMASAANNGQPPCLSSSALTAPERWELNAASFYAQTFNTTVGFGIGASGATGTSLAKMNPSVGGTLSSMLVADANGNTALVTTITYNSLNFGAGVQGGLQVSVGGGPITPGWSGSGSASGSVGAGLGIGVDITNTGAFTLNVGVGLGAKYSATMSNVNASYALPICK